jgi:mRNA-degrading endonuclease RelE of RelBE toxin-antitoxin system
VIFEVFLSQKASQEIDELPAKIAGQVLADCRSLAANPFPDGKRIKKLRGYKGDLYRLRAGDYRIVFERSSARVDIVRVLSKQDFQRAY